MKFFGPLLNPDQLTGIDVLAPNNAQQMQLSNRLTLPPILLT